MSVGEVAFKLAVSSGEVVKTLFMQGIMVQVNQVRAGHNYHFSSTIGDTSVVSPARTVRCAGAMVALHTFSGICILALCPADPPLACAELARRCVACVGRLQQFVTSSWASPTGPCMNFAP